MNKEERRSHFAAIALAQLLIPENFGGVLTGADAKKMLLNKALAVTCVDLADALIAELDRTKPEPETPKADADGWIPHRPGDPMPCGGDMSIVVKHGDGVTTNPEKARFWDGSDDDINCWTGKGCEKPTWAIVAWKPA